MRALKTIVFGTLIVGSMVLFDHLHPASGVERAECPQPPHGEIARK